MVILAHPPSLFVKKNVLRVLVPEWRFSRKVENGQNNCQGFGALTVWLGERNRLNCGGWSVLFSCQRSVLYCCCEVRLETTSMVSYGLEFNFAIDALPAFDSPAHAITHAAPTSCDMRDSRSQGPYLVTYNDVFQQLPDSYVCKELTAKQEHA